MDFLRKNRRHTHSRGFTLIELMVVVVIIAILAAIAVPGVAERMRERRASQAAQEIALLYRDARMRALGHGSAVLVHYDTSTVNGFETREAILGASAQPGGCAAQPTGGCQTNNWADATKYLVVSTYLPIASAGVVTTMNSPSGATGAPYVDICFTPRGRAFSRDSAGAPLTTGMAGVGTVNVNRGSNTLNRTVTIPPNGMARVAL
ncbi:MAG TPA: prepilin-type N-terminal cleavage/methylation domain-containing protein [Polyangiaceae bacterium]